jgi:two-component system cell cycle response regulator
MKPLILVIEDSKTHLKVILHLLEEFGFSLLHAENEKDALSMAKSKKPEMILLDLSLPGVGGLEVCRSLGLDQETSQIPIMILTQKKNLEDKIAAFEAGVQDFLTKPYQPEELRARILSVLRTSEKIKFLETEKKRLEEQMEHLQELSSKDSLTALLNKNRFMSQLKVEFVRSIRYHLPLTLCSLDIDRFREINHQFGESSGDNVLAEAGRLLRENFREIDFLSRFDRDRFLIGLPQSTPEDAMIPLTRFQKQISQITFKSIPEEHKVAISIGISALPNPNITNEQHLHETALKALLKAKESGGNRIAIWEEER